MRNTFDIDESEVFKRKSFSAIKRREAIKKIVFFLLCLIAACIIAACIAVQFVE